MVKSTTKDYFSSTQSDRIVCQKRDGINVLPFNQITDEELASDLNNKKMDTNNNLQDKKTETMDTDFLNNYNMDDNIDKKYNHTFFRKLILILMSQTQMKVCISTKTTFPKISIIQIIFLSFISTYVAYRKI